MSKLKTTTLIPAVVIPLLIAIIIMLSIFRTPQPYEEEFLTAQSNYVHVDEARDVYMQYTRHDKKFNGDCEDFCYTLRNKIGGECWAVDYDTQVNGRNVKHAVLELNGVVYDSLMAVPVSKDDYPNEFLHPLTFKGFILDNSTWPPTIVEHID